MKISIVLSVTIFAASCALTAIAQQVGPQGRENCSVSLSGWPSASDKNDVRKLGETCIALRNERDTLLRQADALAEEAAISNIDGMTPANICMVLSEIRDAQQQPLMNERDAERCFATNSLDTSVVSTVSRFQALIGIDQRERDGWLKSDQYVQLVCIGVKAKGPNALRYAGWMFATGQGLPQHPGKAKFLLNEARGLLIRKAGDRQTSQRNRDIAVATLTRTEQVLDELQDRNSDPAYVGSLDSVCPDISQFRSSARARWQFILPSLRPVASAPSGEARNLMFEPLPSEERRK